MRVLVVNAGSTSLKLHLVEDGEATAVDDVVAADAVGYRIVHGGTFDSARLLTAEVEAEIERLATLAPLQNRPALDAIASVRVKLPDVPHVAVFDTTFHRTLPPAAAAYAIPRIWRERHGIRRVGFHGISGQWVATQGQVPRLEVLGAREIGCPVVEAAKERVALLAHRPYACEHAVERNAEHEQ